jgi:TonB family protein
MRVQFPQSIDFNQMLVFSVFGHLFLLTGVLFLPKPAFLETKVVPAFMVNLVSEPAGLKAAASKRSEPKVKPKKPRVRKKQVKKKTAPKKIVKKNPAPKPTALKKVPTKAPKSNGVLEALNKLETKAALVAPNVVEELAQVARLEKPRVKPSPAKPTKQKPIAEKTFRDLETLKNKKINGKKAVAPAPLHKDVLEDFEKHKMEESPIETTVALENQPESVPVKQEPEKPKSPGRDLLKELEQIAKLDSSPVLFPSVGKEEPESGEKKQGGSESYDPIIEKLGALSVDSEPIKVEVFSARLDSASFQSKLRTLPKASQVTSDSGTGDSYVVSKKEGNPGADVQSLYVGMVQERIFKNWREPLAEKHNQEAVVSFFIFPGGNTDKPFIKKSSGVEALDTLAVRAVLDSVPFPEFPKELKMSNLHINIYFKYVPKDE